MSCKTELHCHSAEVSKCSHLSVESIVETYVAKGISSLVLTNHYSPHTFSHMSDASWKEKNDFYVSAYHKAVEAANGRINILLGMEFRNIYSDNDYLIYGMTEEFIYKYSNDEKNLIEMHIKDVSKLVREHGMLFFQAHPFRNGMTVINPSYLDGIEVYNGHPRHDSRNDIASMWADKFNLLRCGGSDCHDAGDESTVSLVTDEIIDSNEALIAALKSGAALE